MKDENLTEAQSKASQAAYDAVNNIKRLNESLLLLAKIENKQFSEEAQVDIKKIIVDKQRQFLEKWENLQIKVHSNVSSVYVQGNAELIEILLNNLFSNAT